MISTILVPSPRPSLVDALVIGRREAPEKKSDAANVFGITTPLFNTPY